MSSKTADSGAHGTVVKKFGKGQRQVPSAAERASKYYPSEDVRQLKQTRKTLRQTKLRPSLQPGTILILLAGRFRGKRVILLRHLDQGVLLITGPFKANGVPLRRVNARYVIATSQSVDLNGVDAKIVDKVSQDGYFTKDKQDGKAKSEEAFFKQGVKPEKKQVASARAEDQKNVDKALLATIKKTPHLLSYLHSTFSLRNGDKPHEMNF